MTRVIWKYEWGNRVKVQHNADIISAGYDPEGTLCIWAIVDPNEPKDEEIELYLIPTGHIMPSNRKLRFLNTVKSGPFVWHLFVEDRKSMTIFVPGERDVTPDKLL